MAENETWKPGSFTKNFSWGSKDNGLSALYNCIRVGFDQRLDDVHRDLFRERISRLGRPDFIPINFFLFNRTDKKSDDIIVDELVFQAIMCEHSNNFDKLALFAFNFSYVGKWTGASPDQRRPALWAFHYIKDRIAKDNLWNTAVVSASDIQNFVSSDKRYAAKTAGKLATNLNYLYMIGKLPQFSEKRVERWWADAVFLALDRITEDRKLDGEVTQPKEYVKVLSLSGFQEISGKSSLDKNLALKHLINLYTICGGRDRFYRDKVVKKIEEIVQGDDKEIPNSDAPVGAVHPTNPHILKSIPSMCMPLAKAAGFDIVRSSNLDEFNNEEYAHYLTQSGREMVSEKGIAPIMSAEELMKLTRGR
ncbi:hypothetical protein [Azospirillum sp. TSA6c]|uniref:hypothetical protein n=1 Tax=unclassified Azospirillum TaxID=2630922 RepID=UPI0011B4D84D|nr:hypothetical protein [Azospirillum sp. TSA6c]